MARGFADVSMGNTFHFAGRDGAVVGTFDANRSGRQHAVGQHSDREFQPLSELAARMSCRAPL